MIKHINTETDILQYGRFKCKNADLLNEVWFVGLCYGASCCVTGGQYKIFFGRGIRLNIESCKY